MLSIPTFALALATTTVTSYMPVLARQFTGSTAVIGVIVGAEGFLALWLPLTVGSWSDRLRTPIGGRLPFVLAGTPLVVLALSVMGFVRSLPAMAVAVFVFFVGYVLAYEPYRALYPDAVPDAEAARSQGAQGLGQGIGTGLALVGGGLLLALAKPAPFIAAAVIVPLAIGFFAHHLRRHGIPKQSYDRARDIRGAARDLREMISGHPALRNFLIANAFWELSLSALKTFVVLYITTAVGLTIGGAAGVLGGAILVVMVASVAAGKLGDRFGKIRIMQIALPFYGIGLLIPFFTHATILLAPVIIVVAFGGGLIMTLPYAILMPLMPDGEHGSLTGFYSLSRGIGTMLGPLCAGGAIEASKGLLPSTQGYPAMWLVSSAAILASTFFLARLRRSAGDRAELRDA